MWAWRSMYSMALGLRVVGALGALLVELLEQLAARVAEDHLHALHALAAAVDQDGERLADRAQPEVVVGVDLARAVEAVQERRQLEHLDAVLHEVLGDQLLLRQGASAGVGCHPRSPPSTRRRRRPEASRSTASSSSCTSKPEPMRSSSMTVSRPPRCSRNSSRPASTAGWPALPGVAMSRCQIGRSTVPNSSMIRRQSACERLPVR